MSGDDHASKIDSWVRSEFKRGRFHLFIKTKHLAMELKMTSGQVSSGFRILRHRKLSYSLDQWKVPGKKSVVWNIVHPVLHVGKFLASFAPKDSIRSLY